VAAGEEVAFEPPLALVLGEDLHDAAVVRHVLVRGVDLGLPLAVGGLEDGVPAVGGGLVRAEDAEVAGLGVELEDVAQELPLDAGRLGQGGAGEVDLHGVVAEVGYPEVAQHGAAVGVGVGAHPPLARGGERRDLGAEPAALVEQLLRAVAAHPLVEHPHVLRAGGHLGHRHLMGAPGPLDRLAVHDLGAGPPLGGAEDDHRPAGALAEAVLADVPLDAPDLVEHLVHHSGHALVHGLGLVPFHVIGGVAVAAHQVVELLVGDAGEHGGPGDLVAVEVEDGEHGAVVDGVEELVRVPARGEGAGLGLAVADDAGGDQVRVVEHGAIGVGEGVAELAPLVDRAGGLGRRVAGDAAGERELFEQAAHPLLVLGDVGVDLAVGPFEVGVGHHARAAVAGAADVDHAEIARLDGAVQVDPDEVEAGGGPPVAEQTGLDVLDRDRLLEQRVLVQVNLSHGEIVGRAPPRVDLPQDFGRERTFRHEAPPSTARGDLVTGGRRGLGSSPLRRLHISTGTRRSSPVQVRTDRAEVRTNRRRRSEQMGVGVRTNAAEVRTNAVQIGPRPGRPHRAAPTEHLCYPRPAFPGETDNGGDPVS
jgi:hypothetical protein